MDILNIISGLIHMSFAASIAACIVLPVRLLLKRLSAVYSYVLWLAVFVRFVWPFTFMWQGSPMPAAVQEVSVKTMYEASVRAYQSVAAASPAAVDAVKKAAPVLFHYSTYQWAVLCLGVIWVTGIAVLAAGSFRQYRSFGHSLRSAVRLDDTESPLNTDSNDKRYIRGHRLLQYSTDQVDTPILFGLLHPAVYFPAEEENTGLTGFMNTKRRQQVLMHEAVHVRRLDHLVKPLCVAVVVLHWMNPMVWIAYRFMVKDMELSCDELAVRGLPAEEKAAYADTLLRTGLKHAGSNLFRETAAFAESDTAHRIHHILKFRTPAVWLTAILAAAVLILVFFLMSSDGSSSVLQIVSSPVNGEYTGATSALPEGAVALTDREIAEILVKNRSPYIGDASNDGRLAVCVSIPEGYRYGHMELQTTTQPYELALLLDRNGEPEAEAISLTESLTEEQLIRLRRSAALLMAAVENLGQVRFGISDALEQTPVVFTREEMESRYGELYPYSDNVKEMQLLIRELSE